MNNDKHTRLKFTTKEKRGVLVIFVVMILVVIIPRWLYQNKSPLMFVISGYQDSLQEEIQSTIIQSEKEKKSGGSITKKSKTKPEHQLHPFDPDTLSKENWQQLGLSEKQSEVLLNYKERLGGFTEIENLYKAFVLDSQKVKEWEPFLQFNRKKADLPIYDLNTVTADELQSLKGIGPTLSLRIIKYRDALGGFYSISQLQEVYGLPDETYLNSISRLEVRSKELRVIPINNILADSLRKHPYIDYKSAQLIIKYREQHGAYESKADLEKIKAFEDDFIQKIEPYFNFAP
ncbi:ComEA family DNA-binding protein [Wandonia haliotis]